MSISSEQERILIARNKIRAYFVGIGLATGDETIDELSNIVESIQPGPTTSIDYGSITFINTNGEEETVELTEEDVFSFGDNHLNGNQNSLYAKLNIGGQEIAPSTVVAVRLGKGFVFTNNNFLNGYLNQSRYFGANLERIFGVENIRYISQGFLDSNIKINCPLNFSGLRGININYFMQYCTNFNSPVYFPPNMYITGGGSYFMYECKNMTDVIVFDSEFKFSGNQLLSVTDQSAPAYQQGIKISGAYAEEVKRRLPNRNSSPYRNLILV